MANDVKVCQECGAELTSDSLQGLCAQCLLKQGLVASASGVSGQTSAVSGQSALDKTVLDTEPRKPRAGSLPREGQRFGDYQIVRMLGQGGMGAVFEAEHLPSERRVALKVLNHALDSPEARQRFLREGQLAASINHPNSIYVFGTEEIDGIPVISMELAPGGTLKDLVKEKGPLPVTEAVDAILQVIAGLEAAQRQGVLHRDIKPSNCFLDADGSVKVGDFGLSISTLARGETQLTATGRILGTPAFASPEQLRGDEMDVRSDIYSVGATLYYLLTGQTLFEETNLVRLVTMVVERLAESPNKLRPEIPERLGQIILRCLAKQPAKRFGNYEQLHRGLAPFSSTPATPAALGNRVLAGMIDLGLWCFGLAIWFRVFEFSRRMVHVPSYISWDNWLYYILFLVIAYFTFLEGIWGITFGKAVCGLRVVGPWQSVPGLSRAFVRAVMIAAYGLLGLTLFEIYGRTFMSGPLKLGPVIAITAGAIVALIAPFLLPFTTCHRRNGLAAWHDLASRTRVTLKLSRQNHVLPFTPGLVEVADTAPSIGPYHVLATLGQAGSAELFLGYDRRLRRKVWIRKLPQDSPEVPAHLRSVTRATRLRWLNGKRGPDSNWDAYEAPTGQALLQLAPPSQPWKPVRRWLADLGEELRAAQETGSRPYVLALDRVWITDDGRAKLLDFPAPGRIECVPPPESVSATAPEAAQIFLKQVALAALEGEIVNEPELRDRLPRALLPLHAREWLVGLAQGSRLESALTELKALQPRLPEVSRFRRFALNVGCWLLPLIVLGLNVTAKAPVDWFVILERSQPDLMRLYEGWLVLRATVAGHYPSLVSRHLEEGRDVVAIFDHRYPNREEIRRLEELGALDERRRHEAVRALEISIAGLCGHIVTNKGVWESDEIRSLIAEADRQRAERIVATHTNLTPDQVIEALKLKFRPGLFPTFLAEVIPSPRGTAEATNVRRNFATEELPLLERARANLGVSAAAARGARKELALLELVRIESARGEKRLAMRELANMLGEFRRLDELRRLERYMAGRFGRVVTNKKIWESQNVRFLFPEGGREFIERLVAAHPNVSSNELAEVTQLTAPSLLAIRKEILKRDQAVRGRNKSMPPLEYPVMFCVLLAGLVALPGLVAAILFRGGALLHGFGIAVVTPNGTPASRSRVLWRAVLTWSPLIALALISLVLVFVFGTRLPPWARMDPRSVGGLLAAYALASFLSLRDPGCGLADRLAGTRLVPK